MAIEVRNLTKYYGTEAAVNDISFDVKTGEILGFLGPNGAGKTTTMKIITCFLPPNNGSVNVDGYNINDHSLEVRRKIGYLPELNPLYTDMNVLEYLEYAAKLQGLKGLDISARMKLMVDVCGLGNVRHKDIGELSKGYKQRVGLAQAIIHDPDVLILDEPTSGLDPNQIIEIRNLIKHIGLAKTVILSTHILSEVQATCDRVVIINKGTIVADGSIGQLQESFHGSEFIILELKAKVADPMLEIFPMMKNIPNADNIELVSSEEDVHKFNIRSPKGSDLRESVFNFAVDNKWVILEMQRKVTSLEELFAQLTMTGHVGNN
jgi:ABC-2 type transport system ATP-binding protein